jgi:predicted ribosome quality control (RQC) complex YloA/Tae2 family protein
MLQISSMDLHFLAKEFNELFQNQRIDNFYYIEQTFSIRVFVSGKGHIYLSNKVSKYLFLTEQKDEATHPSSFVQHLRKYLKSGFIRKITQLEGERILKIEIEKKIDDEIKKFFLFLEVFAGGNIILTDDNYTIKNALDKKKFKDRHIKVHQTYQLPPKKEISPFNINKELFEKMLKETDLTIVKFLAIKLGMGGKFSEEVCEISNIDKNKNENFSKDDINKIEKALNTIENIKINAYNTINEKGEIDNFYPFEFITTKSKSIKETQTFNEAVSNYFNQFKEEKDLKKESYEKELKKLNNIVNKQKAQKEQILKDYEKFNEAGNKIYENFAALFIEFKSSSTRAKFSYILFPASLNFS